MLGDERVSSNDVSVKTVKGVITLHGKVASAEEQKAAEEIALNIEGQKKVVNQLTVVPTAQRKAVDRQDDQIVTDVKQALTKDASLKKAAIDVRASEVARRVSGVRAVRNELAILARAAKASRVDRVEARITLLHAKLVITPAQEELWKNVTQVMRDNAQALEALTKTRAAQAKTMTAVDDLNSYSEIAEAHAAGLKKFVPVFQALYASMSEAQKAQADTLFRGHHRSRTAAKKVSKSPASASMAAPTQSNK